MAKTPAIDYADPENVKKRMDAVTTTESPQVDLVFDNNEPLERKEEKIAFAAKLKNYSEFFMMRAIGSIYTEGQWFTKWIMDGDKRVSIPGDYENETEYMDHLAQITGYNRRYLMGLVGIYRVYKKHEKFLTSINYEKIGHLSKIYHLDRAMEMVDSGELDRAELRKLMISGTTEELAEVVTRQAIPVGEEFDVPSDAKVSVKKDTVFIDGEPIFKIVGAESGNFRETLVSFIKAEKRKSELGDDFRNTVDLYNRRLYAYVSDEKIPVIVPVDSDVSDVKAFEHAATKVMTQFYKDWKLSH